MALTTNYHYRVQWGDCDPARIVHYPNYFRWFDDAANQLFREAGLDWQDLGERYGVVGMPLVDAQARFVSPSSVGDELVVETQVTEWHAKILVVGHRIVNGDRLVVEGVEKRVWAGPDPEDPSRLRAFAIPDEIKQALA